MRIPAYQCARNLKNETENKNKKLLTTNKRNVKNKVSLFKLQNKTNRVQTIENLSLARTCFISFRTAAALAADPHPQIRRITAVTSPPKKANPIEAISQMVNEQSNSYHSTLCTLSIHRLYPYKYYIFTRIAPI